MTPNINLSVEGYYKIMVMQDGAIVNERPFAKNMILNQGKDSVMGGAHTFASTFRYCAAGSGSTAVSATDTGLVTEIVRTGTLLTGSGNCGTTIASQTVTMRRTFDFPVETGSVNYRELGFSGTASSGANLWSRVLISGGVVSLVSGQSLRVVYDLAVTFAPTGTQSETIVISGWPVSPATNTDATWALQDVGISTVSNEGNAVNADIFDTNRTPICTAVSGAITISPFGSNPTGGSAITGASKSGSWGSYTNGTYTRTASFDYCSAGSFSSTAISGYYYNTAIVVKFDQNQTKANTHKLRYNGYTITLS